MELIEPGPFFEKYEDRMFYVGFLYSGSQWFPLCIMGNPGEHHKLDTLLVSSSRKAMSRLVDAYASQISQIAQTHVQNVMREEIANLLEQYGLDKLVMVLPEAEETEERGGCGCGSDCA